MKSCKVLYKVLYIFVITVVICFTTTAFAENQFDLDFDSQNSMTGGDVNIGGDSLDNNFDADMDQSQSNYNFLDFSDKGEIKKVLGNLGGRVSLESFQPPRVIYMPEENARKIWYEQPIFYPEKLLCYDQTNAWLAQGFEIIQMDPTPPTKVAGPARPVRVLNHLPQTGRRLWSWMIQTPINPYPYIGIKVAVSGAVAVTNTDTVVVIIREFAYGENAGNYFKPGANAGGIENLISWGASSAFQTGKGSAVGYSFYHVEVIAYTDVPDSEIYTVKSSSGNLPVTITPASSTQTKSVSKTDSGREQGSKSLRGRYIGFSNGHRNLSDPEQEQALAYNIALMLKNWNMINRVQFYSQGVDESYAAEVRLETGARLYASGIPEQEIIAKFAPDKQYRVTDDLRPQLEKRQLTGVVGVIIE